MAKEGKQSLTGFLGADMKLPQGRIYQIPTELERMFEGIEDINIGPRYMGHVRKEDVYLDMGGPKHGFISYDYTTIAEDPNEIVDGRFELIGPDVNELPEGTSIPYGLEFKIWGTEVSVDLLEYIERMIGMSIDNQEGIMGLNGRDAMWMRISKQVAPKYTFANLFQAVRALTISNVPVVEAMEGRMIIATPEMGGAELIRPLREEAQMRWKVIDAMYAELDDEDVDVFYGCTTCQSFAPNHVCVVMPSMIPYCGILGYASAKAAYQIDHQGNFFEIPKGELIDPLGGEYQGVNEAIWERSHHTIKRELLNSAIKYPGTNCGCFEAAAFYLPDVDGIGVVNRRYSGMTPLGINFGKLAGMISGGTQNHGFKGLSIRGMAKPKFLLGDGGWNRVVWMPKDLKLELADAIPEEVYDKIITEEDTVEVGEIKEILQQKKHPIIDKFWKNGEPQPIELPGLGEPWPGD